MNVKNIKISLLVLFGLIIFSLALFVSAENNSDNKNNIFLDSDQDGLSDEEEKALGTDLKNKDTDQDGYSDGVEIKTGYNPLKKAPGDRIIPQTETPQMKATFIDSGEKNLTEKVSKKISDLASEKNLEGEEISLAEAKTLAEEIMSAETSSKIILPEIKKEDLKIKSQNYSKYSEKKATEKRKEDFSNYLVTLVYVFSSNSPEPITSDASFETVLGSFSQKILEAISLRSTSSLEKLNASMEKIQKQLLEMEVPEELSDTHIKIIQYIQYSREAEKFLDPQSEDPIADIANLSYLSGLITDLESFTGEIEEKFNAYDLDYDETLQKKLENLSIEIPQDIKEALEEKTAKEKN